MKKLKATLIRILIELILVTIIAISFQPVISALGLTALIVLLVMLIVIIEIYDYNSMQNKKRAVKNYEQIKQLKVENFDLNKRIKELEETLMIINKEYHELNGSYLF